MTPIDPISRDVFQHQVRGIAEEMSMSLRRAAFSSIIWDMYDYACGVFTPDGEMLSQADTIPAQLGIMSTAIGYMFAEIPRDTWRSGDIIVCNDPYKECTHTMDVCLFSPVFYEGEFVAITSTIAHHVDIGGAVPGSEAADSQEVFAEGLLIPPLKLVDEGVPNETIFKILAANVRDPDGSAGDLRAQIAGCRTGEKRMAELVRQYGAELFNDLCHACLDYNELFMRRAIAQMDNGLYEATLLIEDDVTSDDPLTLHAKVTLEDESMIVDLSQSSDQLASGLNCPESSTISMVHYAIKALVAPELPQNQGCDRPISIVTRKGSIFDPERPAAVSVRHLTQQALAELVLKALTTDTNGNVSAGSQVSFPAFVLGGFDDRPAMEQEDGTKPYYVIADILGGGMGGSPDGDGLSAVDTHGGNCALLSAEIMETLSPVRVLRTALVPGSGGDGKHRGGLGLERDYEILSDVGIFSGYLQQTRPDTAPWGFAGGSIGGEGAMIKNPGREDEARLSTKIVALRLQRGDVVRVRGAGGGGWGNPAERDPSLRENDALEGFA